MNRVSRTLTVLALLLVGCQSKTSGPRQKSEPEKTARTILESMLKAYRQTPAYRDNAVLKERYVSRTEGLIRESPPELVAITFERPNRLRLVRRSVAGADGAVLDRQVVSDGQRIRVTLSEIPNQVLQRPAPEALTADNLLDDPLATEALFSLPLEDLFPQLALLLSTDSDASTLADDARQREDAECAGRMCYRIETSGPSGRRVLWIDRQSYLLRRVDLPTDALKRKVDPEDALKELSMSIEFRDAKFVDKVSSEVFEIQIPETAVHVSRFVTSHPGPLPSNDQANPTARADYDRRLTTFYEDLAGAALEGETLLIEIALPELAPKSDPDKHRLIELWTAADLAEPGNLLLLDGNRDVGPRIFVIDGSRTVVELNAQGEQVARHGLPIPATSGVSFVRSALQPNGERIFLASGAGRQQIHLFDAHWQPKWSFPKGRHAGISDAKFCDLDADGEPEICVGYWGEVGLQGVSLQGRRIWADRLDQVMQLAVQPAAEDRSAQLWCAYQGGSIARYGAVGPLGDLYVDEQIMIHIAIADVDGDGEVERCGLAFVELGAYRAVGISETGQVLWSYELPKGEFRFQVERITPAPLATDGGWLLPAADGSLHWLGHDGRLVDRFNYGAWITGLAATQIDDTSVLLVSSSQGLTAWRIEPK